MYGMASPLVTSTLQAWLLQRADRNHPQPNPMVPPPSSNPVFPSPSGHMILASLLRGDDVSQHSVRTNGTGRSSGCSSAGLTPPTPPDARESDVYLLNEPAQSSGNAITTFQQQQPESREPRRSSFSVSEILRKDSMPRSAPRSFAVAQPEPAVSSPPSPPNIQQHQFSVNRSNEFAQSINPWYPNVFPSSDILMTSLLHSFAPMVAPCDQSSLFLRTNYPFPSSFTASSDSAFTALPDSIDLRRPAEAQLRNESIADTPSSIAPDPAETSKQPRLENSDDSREMCDPPTQQDSNLKPLQLLVEAVGNDSKCSSSAPDKASIRSSPLLDASCMSSIDGSAASPASTSASHSSASPSSVSKQALAANSNCMVCGDKASGYHYGVVSCEGCKGFFRRTVQKNIENVCHKENDCSITRVTRNRCPACRFRKCLEMGMCKESVRQDRSRKRKLRSEEEERQFQLTAKLQNLIKTVVAAHNDTMAATPLVPKLNVAEYLLNEFNNGDFSKILKFAQNVPGFGELNAHDQSIIWQSGSLEIMLLRCSYVLCCRQQSNLALEFGQDPSAQVTDEIYSKLAPFAQRVRRVRDTMIKLEVRNEEIALLSALCLMCSNRRALQNAIQIEALQEPLLEALQVQVKMRENPDPCLMAKLLMMLSDIRSLTLEADVPAIYPATAALALSQFAANGSGSR